MAPPRHSDENPVVFRFRPPRAAPFVDLRGEMTHFQHVSPMRDLGDGQFEKTVRLGTGVFAYKYFGGGDDWWLDPENPRTRSRDGARNSVVVVGGTEEPVLHAPARPFVFATDDGRLCVRAALRKGNGEALSLRWDEGDGPRETPMLAVAEEDEHLLFEAHLPQSARAVEYLFVLPGSGGRWIGRAGGAAQPLRVARSEVVPETPAWWRDAAVYTVLIDRFRRGATGTWGPAPDSPLGRWGGDLDGVTAALPYLADLGVTVIHLTPVALAPSAHRYDAVDPRAVDPAIGGEPALQRLLQQAHAKGLRVLLDVAVTHVDRDFFAFRDVRDRGPRSPYWGWFHIHRYPFSEGIDFRPGADASVPVEHRDPGYLHYQKGQWREPLLRTDEPEVVEYLAETFARWAALGVDGFRVDAAADLPLQTIRRIGEAALGATRRAPSAGDGLVLFGEVIPPNIHRFTADALDAATDFAVQEALYDWLSRRRIGASRVASLCARRRFDRGGPAWTALAFTATHDQHRFRSLTGDPRPARLAQLFVLTGAAVPMLLYGDEVGMTGGPAASQEFEGVWPDRAPMKWPAGGQAHAPDWDSETLNLVKTALHLRREHEALRRGDETFFPLPSGDSPDADDVLVVRRTAGDEIFDVIFHGGEGARTVPLPSGAPSGAQLLLTLGEVALSPSESDAPTIAPADGAASDSPGEPAPIDPTPTLRLGPWSAAVLRRVPSGQSLSLWRDLSASGALLSGLSFREGSVESAPLPVHLYVTVTERCNISCLHCITSAPEKTTSGRARTAAPWLVEALREPFAAADYVGFVHGGESLVAPVFWDILRAIQTAPRRAAPAGSASSPTRPARPDVHLLSNGMLLDEGRVRKLIEHGVTSLSVSLDGATEVTNDSLRKGGRLPAILHNLRRAAEIRSATKADLRIGVSTVVTSGDVSELSALGEIVADLGLDWLKVEEIYPCTPTARHQMIHGREPRVEEAMNDLRRALARTSVVIVDHRDPPSGCACEAAQNPLLAEFRKADDFANRTVFHPCRMEWEQACIDPDGTVHPVDYSRLAIGNLLHASLLELWNGPEIRALRKSALSRTPKRLRTRCPLVP